MKKYTVYFEIYGKKMKTTVHALSKQQAEAFVRNKLIIHKVEEADIFDKINDIFNQFDGIFSDLK